MSVEAMKLALAAFETLTQYNMVRANIFRRFEPTCTGDYVDLREFREKAAPVITALQKALAQPQQEPVDKKGSPCPEFWDWLPKAYNFEGVGNFTKYNMEVAFLAGMQTTSPPARKPLTDEEKLALLKKHFNAVCVLEWFDALLLDIEAAHGIKGEA